MALEDKNVNSLFRRKFRKERRNMEGIDPYEGQVTTAPGVSDRGIEVRRADSKEKGAIAHGYGRVGEPEKHKQNAKGYFRSVLSHVRSIPKMNLPKSEIEIKKDDSDLHGEVNNGIMDYMARHFGGSTDSGSGSGGKAGSGDSGGAGSSDSGSQPATNKETASALSSAFKAEPAPAPQQAVVQQPVVEPNPLRHWKATHDPATGMVHFHHSTAGVITVKKQPRVKLRGDFPYSAAHNGKSIGRYKTVKEAIEGVGRHAKTLNNQNSTRGTVTPQIPGINDMRPPMVAKSEDLGKSKNVREQKQKVFGNESTPPKNSPMREKHIEHLKQFTNKFLGIDLKPSGGKISEKTGMRRAKDPKIGIDKPDWRSGQLESQWNPDAIVHEIAHLMLLPKGIGLEAGQRLMDQRYGEVQAQHGYMQQKRSEHEVQPMAAENIIRRHLGLPATKIGIDVGPDPFAVPLRTQVEDPNKVIAERVPKRAKDGDIRYIDLIRQSKFLTPENKQRLEDIFSGKLKFHHETGWVPAKPEHHKRNLRSLIPHKAWKSERNLRSILRELRKDEDGKKQEEIKEPPKMEHETSPVSEPLSYIDKHLQTARAELARRMQDHPKTVQQIEEKFKGKDKSTELAKLHQAIKHLKDGVEVGEKVKAGKDATIPPNISMNENNAKLKKDKIVAFSLPAGHTSRSKAADHGPNYSHVSGHSKDAKADNWAASEREDFVPRMNATLKKYKAGQKIRVHDSGDFYNQEYIDKWHQIASQNPDKKFYAYTKSLDLDWKKLHKLPNFHVIQSVGGQHDKDIDPNLPHAYVFPDSQSMKAAGYEDASDSDSKASDGAHKNGIVLHSKEIHKSEKSLPLSDTYKFDQPDAVHQAHHESKSKSANRLRFMALKRLGHG